LLKKIQNTFDAEEQQLFVASFYCYLKYDSKKDFIINFEDVWKWCGFTRQNNAKRILESSFTRDIDYKVKSFAPIGAKINDPENKGENFAAPIGAAKTDPENKGETAAAAIAAAGIDLTNHSEFDKKDTFEIRRSGKNKETRGGHNKETILLTVNCFKKFCMKADTKKADQIHDYYIKLEELLQETLQEQSDELQLQLQKKEIETKEHQKQLEQKSNQLREEQKNNNKLKTILSYTQGRYSHYHKFEEKQAVYIVQDTNNTLFGSRYKIGKTDDMNERLASYRTSMPAVKVKLLFYTEHADLFERVLKRKYADNFEFNSHEWVFEDLAVLIQSFYDLDKMCNFKSIPEKELWRYNLEDPPLNPDVIEVQKTTKQPFPVSKTKSKTKPVVTASPNASVEILTIPNTTNIPVNIPHYNDVKEDDYIVGLLPTRKLRCDYVKLEKDAPAGTRFCNYWCQKYVNLTEFKKISVSYSQHCKHCENLMMIAKYKLDNGELTSKEIRDNPALLNLKEGERYCHMCNKCLPMADFTRKDRSRATKMAARRECRKCHNKQARRRHDLFDEKIEFEADVLDNLEGKELDDKLASYTKSDLHKFMTYFSIGRKFNDRKHDCINKLKLFLIPA
jgi:hypothetical protein